MAASFNESQKIDYLWKKVGYGVTKTAEPASKEAFNESIPSPLLYRGDLIWTQSGDIPASPPASTTALVQVYKDGGGAGYSPTVQCTEDLTAPDNQTWKTNLINWIPTQFGDNYLVQVYAGPTGLTNPQTAGTKLFGAGSGSDDTWFFDYQSGVLNFNGATIPTAIGTGTANTIYVVGYRYVGEYGVDTTFISNGTSNVNIATANGNITMGVNGTGNVAVISNTGAYISGVVSASGNVTGNYFIGNGSQLTGVTASSVNANALTGDTLSSNVLYSSLTQVGTLSNVSVSGNVTGGNVLTGGLISAIGNVTGGNVLTGGTISATATITGGNLLTGGLISATSTITSAANITGGNLLTAGSVSATADITGGNLLSGGLASVTGNVTGGNLLTGGITSATGNITGGNVLTSGLVSATGTVTGSSLLGSIASLSGNITGGNVLTGGSISATSTITSAANITGGNVLTGGLISATGNIISQAGSFFIGNGSQLTGVTAASVDANALTGNTLSANVINSSLTSVGNLTLLSVVGNTTSGNVLTGGLISATSTITGSSLLGSVASLSGNVTGGNLLTGGLASVSGNVTGGNLLTDGLISATGNIQGGNVNTNQLRNASGNLTIGVTSGNLLLQPSGNIVLSANTYINNLAYPEQDGDAATKQYVDNFATTAISYHQPVAAATTTTLATTTGGSITYTQPNGVANGIGALLTTTGSFNLIDTANVQTVGTRILVKNEANAVFNGVYTWANSTNIIRSSDADSYGADQTDHFSINDYFYTTGGNVNAGTAFIVSAPTGVITFGTSNIEFSTFSTSQVYSANTAAGISLNGTVINAKVDDNTTAFDGGGNIIVKAGANLTTPNIGAATGTSISLTGNATSGNVLTGGVVSATANVTGGNVLTGGLISATSTITSAANITGGNVLTGGVVSATANVIGGNISTAGLVSATGTITSAANITGANLLTGGLISSTGAITSAANVNANNVIATTIVNAPSLTGTIASLSGNVTGGNVLTGGLVSATANITGGNILTVGIVSTSGNVYGNAILSNNYYYANGTPVPPGIIYTAATSPPVSSKVTDQWYDTSSDVLYEYINDGTSNYWVDTTSPAFAGGVVANVAISGTLIPIANVTYDIGTSSVYFRNTYTQNLYTNNRLPASNMPLGAVIQTVMSSSLGGSITNSTSYADVTSATVTITPSSATSKILIIATGTSEFSAVSGFGVTSFTQLVRGASTSLQVQNTGTSGAGGVDAGVIGAISYSYMDAPGTASAVTYKLQQKVSTASSTLTSTNIWLIALEIAAS